MFQCRQLAQWPVAGVPSKPKYFESESVGRQQGDARRLKIERPIPYLIEFAAECLWADGLLLSSLIYRDAR